MVFFRISWMTRYQGQENDPISGGGSWVEENRSGGERCNFLPVDGTMYGYAKPPRGWAMRIERLGAQSQDEEVSGILVVWVARRPQGSQRIVGWYNKAIVHREFQDPVKEDRTGHMCTAREGDCGLIEPDVRNFEVPVGTGWMGQSNVWYADRPEHQQWRDEVQKYLQTQGLRL